MRGLELTSALMDLAKNPNMDECKAVANKGNGLLHTAFVFGKTCPSPWILMRTAINRATRAARRAREVPIDAIRCTESFTEPSVRAIDRLQLSAARKDRAFRRFLDVSGLSAKERR